MELINPNEIGAKISTLIAEATESFCAVTPYVKIADWKKIIVNLAEAKRKKVSIKFFIREIDQANYHTLKNIGIELFEIPGLHTKLYFNEKEVIVSSMNLYEFSDLHSIDLAILYNDSESYIRLNNYFKKYIESKASYNNPNNYFENYIESKTSCDRPLEEEPAGLLKIQQYLSRQFSNAKITLSGNYLFTKDIIPGFEVSIEATKMTLKLPNKKATDVEVDKISNNVFNTAKYKTTLNKPTEQYKYYTWDIHLEKPTNSELLDLVNNLNNVL